MHLTVGLAAFLCRSALGGRLAPFSEVVPTDPTARELARYVPREVDRGVFRKAARSLVHRASHLTLVQLIDPWRRAGRTTS